jgi:hypothetical protein
VVVGIDAPYRTFVVVLPGGTVIAGSPENNAELGSDARRVIVATRLVQAWSADMSFALNEMAHLNAGGASGKFRGKLDLQHVGHLDTRSAEPNPFNSAMTTQDARRASI